MADKRIIELEERTTISENDYFATDNTNGTCKVNANILLDRFDDDEDDIATRAKKVDLTNISTTGSTNNSGATITSGTFFYKDGTLARAKANIANGATLTLNTNYEIVTAGGLNPLNEALDTYLTQYEIALSSSVSPAATNTHTIANLSKYKYLLFKIDTSTSAGYRFGNLLLPKSLVCNSLQFDHYINIDTSISANPYAVFIGWDDTNKKIIFKGSSSSPNTIYYRVIGIF